MPGLVRIKVTQGSQAGKTFEFREPDKFVCGRMPDCKLIVADDLRVSRHHFLLEINPPEVLAQDLGSRNGTFVGVTRIGSRSAVPLRSGDVVRAGATALIIEIQQGHACCGCGRRRDAAVREAPILVNGRWLCDACSSKRQPSQAPRLTEPRKETLCAQCGAQAPAGAALQGGYLCVECRKRIAGGDRSAVKGLFARAFGGLRELAAAAGAALEPDTDLTDYEIDRKLGDGRLGPVFLARRKASGAQFAVKILAPAGSVDERVLRRFQREMEITAKLRHPNVVRMVSNGHTNCVYYLVMEYLPGGDLRTLVRGRGGLPIPEALEIVRQAAAGLACAHEKGFIHRDLRPNDIMLAGAPGRWTAKVGDFGLATCFQRSGLSSGNLSVQADPTCYAFAPLEKLTDYRSMTPASDVFALGAILYYALCGRCVYGKVTGVECVQAVLDGKVVQVTRTSLPQPLALVLERCLAVKAAFRYQDAGELERALTGLPR